METQPQAGAPSAPSSNQQLDSSVVNLTKAIGKAESGGSYTAGDNTGDGASSSGAYQFTPGFLSEWAPKAGVQYSAGTKLTPAQQDQIAYNAVKTMGTTGDPAYPELGKLTPAQISSAWNTGNPNAYLDPDYGKNNTYGSTEAYVNKVSQYYDEYSGGSSSNPLVPSAQASGGAPTGSSASSNSPSLPDWLVGGAAGIGTWLLSNAGNLGKDALEAGGAALGGAVGDVPGGIVGEQAGAGIADALGLGKTQSTSSSSGSIGSTESTQTQSTPDLTQEGNQVDPNKIPQEENVGASQMLQNAINQSLQNTQSGRVFSQSAPGKDAINTAASFGLIEPDENGNISFNEDRRKELLGKVGELQDKVIASQDTKASPGSVANYAGSYIGKDKFATDLDRQAAADEVRKNIGATGIPMNGQMSLSDMREKQKQHYAEAKPAYGKTATTAHMLAHKALGNAYGRVIRDNMKDPQLYDRTKKMEQNLITAKEVGKKLHGKKAAMDKSTFLKKFGGRVLQAGVKAAEIYIGDRVGGPVGAIIANMIGEHLNGHLSKTFNKTVFETKGMKAALDILQDGKPEAYNKIIEELKKNGVKVSTVEGTDKKPTSKAGLAKDVIKDAKAIKPKGIKGLVSLPHKR